MDIKPNIYLLSSKKAKILNILNSSTAISRDDRLEVKLTNDLMVVVKCQLSINDISYDYILNPNEIIHIDDIPKAKEYTIDVIFYKNDIIDSVVYNTNSTLDFDIISRDYTILGMNDIISHQNILIYTYKKTRRSGKKKE
jgi:hypothetical protein